MALWRGKRHPYIQRYGYHQSTVRSPSTPATVDTGDPTRDAHLKTAASFDVPTSHRFLHQLQRSEERNRLTVNGN